MSDKLPTGPPSTARQSSPSAGTAEAAGSADGLDLRSEVPVSVEAVSKVYETRDGPVRALDEVSVRVEPGEFVALLGPSGCGKTTLLMMASGLLPVTTGRIVVGDSPVVGPVTDLGIVFQEATLLPWRNVLDNVMLQAEIRKLPKDEFRGHALELLDSVGLAGFESKFPHELSGGMKQRVSLVRALVHEPPLLMMDEPFGALDALTRDQMNIDIQGIWMDRQPTVFFVTHSVEEAVFLADRVLVFTPRPARVDRMLSVRLPRPRRLDDRESPEFASLVGEIRDVFLSNGVLKQ